MEHQDDEGTWTIHKDYDYIITRRKLVRDYPFLPLNIPVRLSPEDHEKLVLAMKYDGTPVVFATSKIEEYQNSTILFYEVINGQGGIYTRIYK